MVEAVVFDMDGVIVDSEQRWEDVRRRLVLDSGRPYPDEATRRMQEIYREPIKEELIVRRIQEVKEAGVIAAASLTPQRVARYTKAVLEAELDILVIQGTVVSAEHLIGSLGASSRTVS